MTPTSSALVLITSSFPISGDGSEAAGAFVADFAEEIAKHVPVRVVAPGTTNSRETWTPGVEVFRYATPNQPLSTLRLWHPGDARQIVRVMRNGAAATECAARAGPTAHIIALWALPCGEWARRSAKRHDLSYSVWTLGSDIWSLGRLPLIRQRLRCILRGAKTCWSDGIKLANDTRNIAVRDVDFLPSTRRIDHTRTEPLRHCPPYKFLFLGRWHPNKGVDLLLKALHMLTDEDWASIQQITIAGGGPLDEAVRTEVRRLENANRPVKLRGYLKRDQAQQAMLDADYLMIPSRIESIPVVLSDALKLGCPVITTPVGDLPELIQRYNCGLTAKSIESSAFSDALRRALATSPRDFTEGLVNARTVFELSKSTQTMLERICATELASTLKPRSNRTQH